MIAFHLRGVIIMSVVLWVVLLFPTLIYARVTPEDIVNSKKETYEKTVQNYSSLHKQKLTDLAGKITAINKKRTDELDWIMINQALILDEYETRLRQDSGGQGQNEQIKKARYQITYAHEAVAYQAAKIYIFNLTREANIKNDALNLISLFQSDLNSTRSKVIYSQNILEETIK